jgi:hypothetical protein
MLLDVPNAHIGACLLLNLASKSRFQLISWKMIFKTNNALVHLIKVFIHVMHILHSHRGSKTIKLNPCSSVFKKLLDSLQSIVI